MQILYLVQILNPHICTAHRKQEKRNQISLDVVGSSGLHKKDGWNAYFFFKYIFTVQIKVLGTGFLCLGSKYNFPCINDLEQTMS